MASTAAEDWPPERSGWITVGVLSAAYLVSFVDRTILSLLVEPIKAELGFSDTQIALLQGTAFGLFYTILGVLFGWAVDRYSRKRIIGWACTLWCLMTAACGFAHNFIAMFIARMGVGVGEAALSPGAASMIADMFPPARRALAMSVYAMGGSLGVGLSMIAGGAVIGAMAHVPPLVVPWLGALSPWRMTLVIVGLAGLIVSIAIALLREPARRGVTASGPVAGDLRAFLKAARPQLLPQFIGIALFGLTAYAILSWVPAMFIRLHGWTAPEVGWRFGFVFLVFGGSGALIGGWLASRLAARGVRQANLLVAFGGIAALTPFGVAAPLLGSGWLALALLAPVAMCFAIPTGASIAAIQETTPGQLRGQVAALYYLVIGVIGLVFGPLTVAVLTDHVFANPLKIGWSLAIVTLAIQPLAAWSLWRARSGARLLTAA
jgi:MFS family permease